MNFPTFSEFFRALWNNLDPYPWQVALATSADAGYWPQWISVPTGSGKTATLDIAIYTLAKHAAEPLQTRKAPARIVFAVNRRIVVDEAFDRARTIALKLNKPDGNPVLQAVTDALLSLAGTGALHPLEAFPLRGGTFTNNSWARTPLQPTVITTTLDQLGSRLLFRGYGVSDHARSIHAALLANDALLILDEAHTSKAFSDTLQAIAKFRKAATEEISTPFSIVQLTATPPADAEETFKLTPADLAHSSLQNRLQASKPATLVSEKLTRKKLAAESIARAKEFLAEGHRRVLIVVNRVATAEEIKLSFDAKKPDHTDVELLTGRLRPLDRDDLIREIVSRHQLKSAPPPGDSKLILIATQCIEVGADYDFDALVTELAPLDALRQRFGRLNRNGRKFVAPAAILAPEESIHPAKPDPLYGTAPAAVWKWLNEKAVGNFKTFDFGIDAIRQHLPIGGEIDPLLSPSALAPIFLPAHLDLLCQTSPRPHVEPEAACFIHGMTEPLPSVSIVLRDDLWQETDGKFFPAPDAPDKLAAAFPLGTEMAQVPIAHARRWLAGNVSPDQSGDTLDALGITEKHDADGPAAFPAVRLSKSEVLEITKEKPLRPGDILVLRPDAPVRSLIPIRGAPNDQFERAHLLARDKVCLRVTPDFLRKHAPDASEKWSAIEEEAEAEQIDPKSLQTNFADIARKVSKSLPEDISWNWLQENSDEIQIVPYGSDGFLIRGEKRVGQSDWPLEPANLGEQSLNAGEPISLASHSAAVTNRAGEYSAALPEALQAAIRTAAQWHDVGKADPRFQALLHHVSRFAIGGRDQIAKSTPFARSRFQTMRAATELPDGFRHELVSAAAFLADTRETGERELIAHLIASHHGRCRAFAPVVPDDHPEEFTTNVEDREISFPGVDCPLAHLSHGVTERFWKLTRRFGWWGLPYLELLLRLADQTESAKTNPAES